MCWIVCHACSETVKLPLPGLAFTSSIGAFIKAIESFCKFCLKVNIQEILLPSAEHPVRENAYLLMGRVMKNWKNLKQEGINELTEGNKDK